MTMNELHKQKYNNLMAGGLVEEAQRYKEAHTKQEFWEGSKQYQKIDDIDYLIKLIEDYKRLVVAKSDLSWISKTIKQYKAKIESFEYRDLEISTQ